jgi:hypothetical protein
MGLSKGEAASGRPPSFSSWRKTGTCTSARITVNWPTSERKTFPLPLIDGTLYTRAIVRSFSMWSCYWQIGLHPDNKGKTKFSTGQGLWQFAVMLFGVCKLSDVFAVNGDRLKRPQLRVISCTWTTWSWLAVRSKNTCSTCGKCSRDCEKPA